MYKLIVSDFKDTLINSEECISSSIIMEIDKYRKDKNGLFCISYDLGIDDVLFYNKSFDFIDYIIGYSGSVIYNVSKDKYIYNKHILISKIKKLFKEVEIINFYDLNGIVLNHNITDYIKDNKIYRLDIMNNDDNLKLVNELNLYYYISEDLIIITGSNIYECICKLVGKKISLKEVLCVPNDNKFISCTDLFYCIGLSNCKLKVKKVKNDNENKGFLDILKKI